MDDIVTKDIKIIRDRIPEILGREHSWLKLFVEHDVNVQIRGSVITLRGKKQNVRDVELRILDSMSNYYSVFEHPSAINTLFVVDGNKTFSFKLYKKNIQNRYRLVYDGNSCIPVVKSVILNNQFEPYTSKRLLELLTPGKFSVTLGRNTYYSAHRDKNMKDHNCYSINTIRSMSVGYMKDIKVKWDPELSVKQVEFLKDKILMPIDGEYYKSGIICTDMKNKMRVHAKIRLKSNMPVVESFTSKAENIIDKTIVICKLDHLPDIRFKYTKKSTREPELQYSDITFNDNIMSAPSNTYLTNLSYINKIVRYRNKDITIKIIHNITDNYYTVRFTSHDPFVALEHINKLFY